jgi:signal transduction histidine kinase
VAIAVSFWATLSIATAGPKRVLLLNSFGRDFAPWNEYAKSFRAELDRQWPEPVELYDLSLVIARFQTKDQEGPFADYLHALFDDHRLDLIVALGAPAASFFQEHRQQLFPSTPMLLMGVEHRRVALPKLTANDTFVAHSIDIAGVAENILRVLPETTNIAVVIGNSPIETYWLEQMHDALQPLTKRVTFTWFNKLSFDDMLRRVTALPPRSAILFALLSVDAAGVAHEEGTALTKLHAVANAPIFSYDDGYFGRGIVGGPLISVQDESRKAVAVAVRILRGEAASDIKTPPIGLGAPRFDWRELRRWGIDEASLPPGSEVEFRVPTVFEQYSLYIMAAAAVCAIQLIFILMLLVHRRRLRRANVERQQAEEAAHMLSGRLISAQEEERSRLARELHDDLTQRLALLAIDAGREERALPKAAGGEAMRSIREGLVRLSEAVHALSHQLHPSILEDIGLSEALKSECKRFSELGSTRVKLETDGVPLSLPQDVALCLFRIAQEALRNVTRHAHASQANVSLHRLNGGIKLVVNDNGVGFDASRTRNGPHLGHASMRQRLQLLGGELYVAGLPGHGTTVSAWVPLKEIDHESSARLAG